MNIMKMSSAQESGNGTTNIVITETRNKKVERNASMDVGPMRGSFHHKFQKAADTLKLDIYLLSS
ncbi:hypothetical protein Bca52824_076255 [Brassica carinata]|uniref:Uncharacterized protein n=2 Tax=Brassica TaxID=3705 RepID=A0A8X7PS17_BRACI|nr:hypothetical protein Bca52824_076255 [Brassica carinata]